MTGQDSLTRSAAAAGAWLFERAIPFWLQHGIDRKRGGFVETLSLDTFESPEDFKRLRVLTRQIYVFSEGARYGVDRARDAVDHGLEFLFGSMRHPDGGFCAKVELDGRIMDPTRDLYDLAFTLFALAHAYRLRNDGHLKLEALSLLSFIEDAMNHPAGGYIESIPPRLPRRQNPHMHLLEAALACAEHMPDPRFERLCDRLIELCERYFLDHDAKVLLEYYDDDLTAIRDEHGRAVVEPGHHFEWAWLLAEYARVRGRRVAGGAEIAAFALRHGLDAGTGLLHGELHDDGTVAAAGVRVWPHCEWLKAALALPGQAGDPVAAWTALSRFLDVPVIGLYHERWDAVAGRFLETPAPASSLYHITAAIVALRARAGSAA